MSFLVKLFIVGLVLLSGCASHNTGEPRQSYSPLYLDKTTPEEELAFIKAADKVILISVDGVRKVNFAKVMFGKGLNSIKIKEGFHTLLGSFQERGLRIGKTFYKANHEYFIDYAVSDGYIHYWVKDLTENKIIYGKES